GPVSAAAPGWSFVRPRSAPLTVTRANLRNAMSKKNSDIIPKGYPVGGWRADVHLMIARRADGVRYGRKPDDSESSSDRVISRRPVPLSPAHHRPRCRDI